MKVMHSRTGAVLAGAGALILLGGVGGAAARDYVTSPEIKDQTVKSRDIAAGGVGHSELRDSSVGWGNINQETQDYIDNHAGKQGPKGEQGPRGEQGPQGERGPKGEPGQDGVAGLTTDGPYDQTWQGDNGASLQQAVVKCDPGKHAIGGGFSVFGGADDNSPSPEAGKKIQVIASYPYTTNYESINDRGSFKADEWIVKGFNHGSDDMIVRPWVVCADAQ